MSSNDDMQLTAPSLREKSIAMPVSFHKATLADIDAIVALVNSAYRGESSRRGWTTEDHLLGGQRTDSEMIRELITKPAAALILGRDEAGALIASVHLEKTGDSCYLGMLTVAPDWQNAGLGKRLLSYSEAFARSEWGCCRMEMTVISVRHELIAYYERRGYRPTGRRVPFPHGDPKYGLSKTTEFDLLILDKKLF